MARMSEQVGRTAAAALAEIADLPYFRVDADRNVVEMSPAMERLTGFSAKDAVGRSCLRIHRCEECLSGCGVFDQRTVLNKDLELHRVDGTTIRVRKSGQVLLDEEGRITGAIEVVQPMDAETADQTEPGRPDEQPAEFTPVVAVQPGVELTPAVDAARVEIEAIRDALSRSKYHRTRAARLLGMSRTTLWRKMREYGL